MIDPVKITEPTVGDEIPPEASPIENGHQSKFDVVLLSVRRLLKRGAIANLTNLINRLHPADIARVIMHLDSPQERQTIFELVKGIPEQGQVVSELSKEMIPQVLEDRNAAEITWMLRSVPADDVAYILGVLPDERTQEILPLMKAEESQEVANLMAYPKGTAGSIMTTEFLVLPEGTTAQEAIQRLQQPQFSAERSTALQAVAARSSDSQSVCSERPATTPLSTSGSRRAVPESQRAGSCSGRKNPDGRTQLRVCRCRARNRAPTRAACSG